MTQRSFPFDNSSVTEDDWRDMATHWLGTGVLALELNELEVFADASGMNVKVRSGKAWVQGHYFESDAQETLAIAAADATNPRIDRVIVRADFTANTITLAVLQGTPAASPTVPVLTQSSAVHEISLAQVTVPAGDVAIDAAQVTDDRSLVSSNTVYTPTDFNTAPALYPAGVSSFATGSGVAGAPSTTGLFVVFTVKRSNIAVMQWAMDRESTPDGDEPIYVRSGYGGGTPEWGAWQRLLSSADQQSAYVGTSETTTSTAYTDLATVGPSVTAQIGPSQRALIILSARLLNNTAGGICHMSVSGAGITAGDTFSLIAESGAASDMYAASFAFVATGLSVGGWAFTAKYRVTAGTGTFTYRRITVIPL